MLVRFFQNILLIAGKNFSTKIFGPGTVLNPQNVGISVTSIYKAFKAVNGEGTRERGRERERRVRGEREERKERELRERVERE